MALKIKQILDLQTNLDAKALDTAVLKIANNLSDLNDAATARTNLGLGTVAVADLIDADDFTGALATNVASAESTKAYVDGEIAALSSGLTYQGAFDASVETAFPEDITTGDFYKVSGAGTIDGLELAIGDMIIANKDKAGATAATDFDKIDNTESADLLRTGDVSSDGDFTVDASKLASRATIKTFVDAAVAGVDSASEISYDNTTSGLTATNVQDAIDEIVADLEAGAIAESQEDFTSITTTAESETTITLSKNKKDGGVAKVAVNGLMLTAAERTGTEAANEVKFTTSYAIEASDIVSIIFTDAV